MKVYTNGTVAKPVKEMIDYCIETKQAPACLVAYFNAIKKATLINLEHRVLCGLVAAWIIKEAISEAIGLYLYKANKEQNDFTNALQTEESK